MMKLKDILRIEFIGLKAKILDSSDKTLVGREGTIIDETKNMLVIKEDSSNRIIRVQKKNTWFLFYLSDGKRVKIYGDMIINQPVKRLVKKYPKKWKESY